MSILKMCQIEIKNRPVLEIYLKINILAKNSIIPYFTNTLYIVIFSRLHWA